MQLKPVDVVDEISAQDFKSKYFLSQKPVVIRNLAKQWPAYTKWNWDYFEEIVGNQKEIGRAHV